ncbi:hypothetical protein Efla_001183 [Eimeria flavescens]
MVRKSSTKEVLRMVFDSLALQVSGLAESSWAFFIAQWLAATRGSRGRVSLRATFKAQQHLLNKAGLPAHKLLSNSSLRTGAFCICGSSLTSIGCGWGLRGCMAEKQQFVNCLPVQWASASFPIGCVLKDFPRVGAIIFGFYRVEGLDSTLRGTTWPFLYMRRCRLKSTLFMQDLYCVAYAPVQGTCLMDLGEDDYTLETLQKELGYLEKLTSTSLQAFSKYFETAELSTPEGAAALYCLSSFLNRLQVVSLRAGTLAGEILDLTKVDYHDTLKKITAKVKAGGLTPEDSRLEDIYETEKDADWDVPAAGKGKVEFRHAVSMVPPADDASDEGGVTHQPVKADFTRKKVRKATGYAKFNFNAEELQDSGKQSDDETEPKNLRSRSSATKTPSSVTSVESDSRGSAAARRADGSPFSLLFCSCCHADAEGTDSQVVRRGSSVSMGSVQEIQDKDADANWHDSERQSGRFTRIRGRIPTGHASLMKSSSDDMLDVLLAEDTEEGRRARELLLHNTQLNSSSPPLFLASSDDELLDSENGFPNSVACEKQTGVNKGRPGSTQATTEGLANGGCGVLSILECQLSSSL